MGIDDSFDGIDFKPCSEILTAVTSPGSYTAARETASVFRGIESKVETENEKFIQKIGELDHRLAQVYHAASRVLSYLPPNVGWIGYLWIFSGLGIEFDHDFWEAYMDSKQTIVQKAKSSFVKGFLKRPSKDLYYRELAEEIQSLIQKIEDYNCALSSLIEEHGLLKKKVREANWEYAIVRDTYAGLSFERLYLSQADIETDPKRYSPYDPVALPKGLYQINLVLDKLKLDSDEFKNSAYMLFDRLL